MMKKIITTALLGIVVLLPLRAAQRAPEAQALMDYFRSIYGKKILSSACANVNWNTNEAEWVKYHTGKYPAMNTFDFIHDVWSTKGGWIDYSNPTPVLNWVQYGGIVSMMWHFMMPKNGSSSDYSYSPGTGKDDTGFSPSRVADRSSWEYSYFIQRIDKVAEWMKPLRDRHIPILWRPFHEAQGNWVEGNRAAWQKAWFWWGIDGPEAYVVLWQTMYDRMVNHHGLTNLIWVFNYGSSKRWYPGDEYVDIVGTDVYNEWNSSKFISLYNQGVRDNPGKMVALCEMGNVCHPSDLFSAGAKFLYFMPWYDYDKTNAIGSDNYKSGQHGNLNAEGWRYAFSKDVVLSLDGYKQSRREYATGVTSPQVSPNDDSRCYSLSGLPAGSSYKGIVIKGGKKYVK